VLPVLSVLVDLLFFLAGALAIGVAVRAWRTGPDGRPVPGPTAVVLYTLASLSFFSPALLTRGHQVATDIVYQWRPWKEALEEEVRPKNRLLADPPLQMLPFRDLVRRRWLAGEVPLWANELGTGQPLLANAQSAPFAPLHLMALPLPPLRALTVVAAWQVVLGLLLMHALLLRLRAPPAGAALAAVAFGFSTFSVVWAYYPLGMAAMWIPGVLLGLLLAADGTPRGLPGLVICGLGLALSGHPETLAHAALAGGAVTVALLIRGPAVGRGRLVLRLAGAAALTFALAAPFLLPVLEALPASERSAGLRVTPTGVDAPDFEPRFAGFLVDPLVAGSPREDHWTELWNFNEQASLYGGLLTLVLALAGALVLRGRVLAILLGGLVALLTAYKIDPFHALIDSLPVFEHGAHARLRLLWIVAVAIAAGLSLDALLRSRAGRLVLAALTVGALGLLVWLKTPPLPWPRLWWLATLGGGVAVLAVPWFLPRSAPPARLRRWLARTVPVAVLAAVVVELFVLGIRYNPVLPPEMDLEPTPVHAWLLERHREAMAAETPRPFRVLGEGWALTPNVPAVDGLWNVRGHDPARPMTPARFVGMRIAGGYFPNALVMQEPGEYDVAAHAYLGVRYMLTRHRRKWLPAPWQRVYRHQGGRVWENPAALPLFFVPETVDRVPWSDEDTTRVAGGPVLERVMPIRDFARHAVVEIGEEEEGERGTARRPTQEDATRRGDVRITGLFGNRFDLAVASPTGGLVVSSVSHDPGWRVRVDGEPVPLLRANSAFLAFRVPPGDHQVRLVYSPDGWRWGLALCFAAVLVVVVPGPGGRFLKSRRRRPSSA